MAEFGKRELELMQILWHHGEQTAQEVRGRIKDRVADPTVRTMLRILEEKGAVTHKKTGRAFVYRAKVPAKRTIRKMIKYIADGFFGGSRVALVSYMLSEKLLKPADLEKARRAAKAKRK